MQEKEKEAKEAKEAIVYEEIMEILCSIFNAFILLSYFLLNILLYY